MTEFQNWKKNFFTIWSGQAVSQLTSQILQFAIVWYLTDRTGSAIVLSAAMMAGFLPQALLGPVAGVLIDRCSRKRIMITADLLISAVSLILVGASLIGTLPVWLILLVLCLRSVGTAFHQPCLQAVTPQIVPMEELTRCSGYSQALESVSQLLSPAAAAVLYQSWSLGAIIFLDVLGAAVAVLTLTAAVIPELAHRTDRGRIQVWKETKEGFFILRTNRGMMGLVCISALYTLALMPTSALFPLMSMSYFHGTSSHAGAIEVVFSVGLLCGSLLLSRWGGSKNRVYTIAASFFLMSFSLFVSGFLPENGFYLFAVCSWLMGVSGPLYWGMFTPLLQSCFEAECLGRVLSLSASIRLLSGPVGLSFSGVFAETFGVENWFVLAGALVLAAGALCLGIPSVRNCDTSRQN